MAKISVIVPVYNMAQYMEKAIDSLLRQTYTDYEIILVDDGSTDDSPAICDRLACENEKIRVIHKKNGGLSTARNTGIENAKGEFIIFPDPDDWVDEDYLELLISLHEKYNTDLEICGHYVATAQKTTINNAEGETTHLNRDEAIGKLLSSKYFCGFAVNKLYHMDLINKGKLRFDVELGMAQDLHFAFRYMLMCKKIVYDPSPKYYYYQHEGGVTNINHPLTQRKISGLKTYEKLLEMAKESVPGVVPNICSTIANLNLNFMFIYMNSGMKDKELFKKLYKRFKENKKYFLQNKEYSVFHKALGAVAIVSPKLYFRLRKIKMG